MEVVKFFQA